MNFNSNNYNFEKFNKELNSINQQIDILQEKKK